MVRRTTWELADLAETAATDAERLLANAKYALSRARAKATALKGTGEHDGAAGRRRGRLARAIDDLEDLVTATRQITAQTRQRLAGQTRTERPGGSACTIPTPGPSPRGGSANQSSSATRPSSWKATTA